MATTLTLVPIVGINRVHSMKNNAGDNILEANKFLTPPISSFNNQEQGPGRRGKMRCEFLLYQANFLNADDAAITCEIDLPDSFGYKEDLLAPPLFDLNLSKVLPAVSAAGGNGTNIGSPYPTIGITPAIVKGNKVVFGVGMLPAAAGEGFVSVVVDWSHSIAS